MKAAIAAAAVALVASASAQTPSSHEPEPGAAAPPAQEAVAPEAVAPLRLVASVDTAATSVGGAIRLTVEAEPAEGWTVEPPTKATDLGPFLVRGVERLPRASGQAWRLRLVAARAGEVEVPPVRLTARGPGGETAEVATDPVAVSVSTNLPAPEEGEEPSEPEPADLKPALSAPRDWMPLIVGAAIAAVTAVAGFWILRRLRSRRRDGEPAVEPEERKPLRPAWEVALEELDRIAGADYVARGELGRQYVEVTAAVRQYLEDRYGVPALECTTTDLNEMLRKTPVRPETSSRILALLREADLVKFAKASPAAEEARSSEQRAREVVRATIPEAASGREAA